MEEINLILNQDVGISYAVAWLWPAITGIASLASTLFTNKANSDAIDKQNEFNEKMMDKQNEYNSPANQKALYEQAGINPGFLFGGQSGLDSTSSMPQSAGVPQYQAPDVNSIARNLFEAKRLQNETLKNEVDVEKTIKETESYKIAIQQSDERFNSEMAKIRADTNLTDAQKDVEIQKVETEKVRQQEIIFNTENLRYNIQLLQQKAMTEQWSQAKLSAEIDRIIKVTPAEVSELMSRANLNNEQAKVATETINKIQGEVVNLIKTGRSIDSTTIAQMIQNQVNDVKANNQISAELLKSDSPVLNLIYEHTNGMIGDFLKSIGAFTLGGFSNDSMRTHHKRINNRRTGDSSWLFSK